MLTPDTPATADVDSSDGAPAEEPGPVSIRPLRTDGEFRACVEIQEEIWGAEFTERVPPTILQVCQRIGGIAAGAFDAGDRLQGFVFGMTGVKDGELVHWSDMLAVRREARNLGLGQQLKRYQAERVRELGVARMYWTFDPLVARNAHLNLNKLGAEVVEYAVDMYGSTESDLHRIGTDRFVVAWRIGAQGAQPGRELAADMADAPVLDEASGAAGDGASMASMVRVEVPVDIDRIQRESLEEAQEWRARTRRAFVSALDQGYRVTGFHREANQGRCYYTLRRDDANPGQEA